MGEPDIIIIRGAPAAGKSETAKALAQFYPFGVRLEIDTLRSMVISVNWTNQDEHKTLLNISAALVYEFINSGFKPIIVIDTFSGDKLNSYFDRLNETMKDSTIFIFGLYVKNEILRSRLEKRPKNKFKDYRIAEKINTDTQKYKHPFEFQINTSDLCATETANILLRELQTRP